LETKCAVRARRYNPKIEVRALNLMRWGPVPYWAKDIEIGFSTINAMADSKPEFREAFKRRLCIGPIDAVFGRRWDRSLIG
jgi:putative SOS response-associated peptidase YedK